MTQEQDTMPREHTPTPWEARVWGSGAYGSRRRREYINVEGPSYPVARMYSNIEAGVDGMANAEHIVRCVNAYPELVEALEYLIYGYEIRWDPEASPEEVAAVNDAYLECARAALAKAKGGQS